MQIGIKFEGGLADQHKIPAYDGAKSIEGLSRSILIVSNYLVEGKVRRRNFGTVPLDFNIIAHRPGSFETLFDIAYGAAVYGGPIAAGIAGNLLTDLLKSIYKRVTGQEGDDIPDRVAAHEAERAGDVAALVEAVEPSIRLGHNVINHGVININVTTPQNPDAGPITEFNRDTKSFVWESVINNEVRAKLFSVGSFNANNGTGRAFDIEEGRTIPFELVRSVDRETVNTLLSSISSYTRSRRLGDNIGSAIAIRYTSIDALDARVKKIRVLRARPTLDNL